MCDYPPTCRYLRQVIGTGEGLRVAGEAHTLEEATGFIDRHRLGAAVVCIELGAADGIELAGRIAWDNGVPVLVTSTHDESLYAERALRAGVRGYVMKDQSSDVLLHAIDTVFHGNVYLSDRMKGRLLNTIIRNSEAKEMLA